MAKQTPKCERCGRTIPVRRRAASDYCTERCAKEQERDDQESIEQERTYGEG